MRGKLAMQNLKQKNLEIEISTSTHRLRFATLSVTKKSQPSFAPLESGGRLSPRVRRWRCLVEVRVASYTRFRFFVSSRLLRLLCGTTRISAARGAFQPRAGH